MLGLSGLIELKVDDEEQVQFLSIIDLKLVQIGLGLLKLSDPMLARLCH